jgi:hypothetical protein
MGECGDRQRKRQAKFLEHAQLTVHLGNYDLVAHGHIQDIFCL